MHSAATPSQPAVLGHRGAPRKAPENTLAALRLALEDGADGFEFDVQRTADGELVVFHDEDVARLTGEVGAVPTLRWRELRRLRVRGHGLSVPIPHLEEVFELVGSWPHDAGRPLLFNLEMKATGQHDHRAALADDVAAALIPALRDVETPTKRWVVSSFDAEVLRRFHGVAPGIAAGALVDDGGAGDWRPLASSPQERPADLTLAAVHPHVALVAADRVAAWRTHGWAVHVWTANDEQTWRPLSELGVDAIISDEPGPLRAWLERPEVG